MSWLSPFVLDRYFGMLILFLISYFGFEYIKKKKIRLKYPSFYLHKKYSWFFKEKNINFPSSDLQSFPPLMDETTFWEKFFLNIQKENT